MNTRLLNYRPELEFLPPSPDAAHTAHQNELAAAAELLEVASETELRDFLCSLIGQQATSVRAALAQGLQQAARIALPLPPGPIKSPLIDALSRSSDEAMQRCARIFGLELEGLSPEDEEFELSRRFVRYAIGAAREAAGSLPRAGPLPPTAVRDAVLTALARAARHDAPGLLARLPQQWR